MTEKMGSKKHETVHAHGGHHAHRSHHLPGAKVVAEPKPVPRSRLERVVLALDGTRLGRVVIVAFAVTSAMAVVVALDRRASSPVFDDGGADATETEAASTG